VIRLNKKLIYIFVILVVGSLIISACEQAVGRKVNRNLDDNNAQVNNNVNAQNLRPGVDYEVFSVPEISQEESKEDITQMIVIPEQPSPGRDWVVGAQCGGIINEDTILDEDLNCEGSGLRIDTSDVSLNCNGHRITGPGYLREVGVGWDERIYGISANNVEGLVISGCKINRFGTGIALYRARNSEILLNELNGNLYGINFDMYSIRNIFRQNTANNNERAGILVYSSSNTFIKNTANNNERVGILTYGNSNTFTENTANNNNRNGIFVFRGSRNTLTENTASENGRYGILIEESSSNIIMRNMVSRNRWGIGLYGPSRRRDYAHNHLVRDNTMTQNSGNGLLIVEGKNNSIERNNIVDNFGSGIVLGCNEQNICSSENTIERNTLTGNGEGIRIEGPNSNNRILSNSLQSNGKGFLIRYGARTNTISNNNICFSSTNDIKCEYIFNANQYNTNTCNNNRISRTQCNYNIQCSRGCGIPQKRGRE